MNAKKGHYVRVKEELIKDYETRGYVHNLGGYEVTNLEPSGVFIKEFGYIILHGDYEIIEEPEHVLVTIKNKMYGDYVCACGCNKILGTQLGTYCYGIGYADDEEGMDWRLFHPECWKKIATMSPEDIYNKYETNRLA